MIEVWSWEICRIEAGVGLFPGLSNFFAYGSTLIPWIYSLILALIMLFSFLLCNFSLFLDHHSGGVYM